MKINIYYGGRGLIDDPTIHVINRMQEVLEELRIKVERINLFEQKNAITTLPQTLHGMDGIILATSVEWFGIGGYMQQFLDACWLFGNKEVIRSLYMQPVVLSTTYGEKEGLLTLTNAWEVLGGPVCEGLCAYVDNLLDFELNQNYLAMIEKKVENLYRTISQKMTNFPSSNRAMQQSLLKTHHIELTPKESEQLSKYASDDTYLKKQKQDIEELSSLFKGMMTSDNQETASSDLEKTFLDHFIAQDDFSAKYQFEIQERPEPFHVRIDNRVLKCYYGKIESSDVSLKLSMQIMNDIVCGRKTFQKAFMTGELTSKGEFKTMRMLDQIFNFNKT